MWKTVIVQQLCNIPVLPDLQSEGSISWSLTASMQLVQHYTKWQMGYPFLLVSLQKSSLLLSELLAIYFTVLHFCYLIEVHNVVLLTEHKPLSSIFKFKCSKIIPPTNAPDNSTFLISMITNFQIIQRISFFKCFLLEIIWKSLYRLSRNYCSDIQNLLIKNSQCVKIC